MALKIVTPKTQYILFLSIVLTVIYISLDMAFTRATYIPHAQFQDPDNFEQIVNIAYQKAKGLYISVFIIDFVWAPLLLLLGLTFLKRNVEKFNDFWYKVFSILALFFDYWENLIYMNVNLQFWRFSIETVQQIKLVLYAIVAIIFLYNLIKYFNHKETSNNGYRIIKKIIPFFKYSFISIFIVVLILALLTQMDQGGTVIVDLLYRPFNLVFLFFLLFFMALALSHYPSYIEAFNIPKKVYWCINSFLIPVSWLGIGLVHFDAVNGYQFDPTVKSMKHFIGHAVFSAFLYVLLFIGNRYYSWFLLDGNVVIFVFIFYIYLYRYARGKDWLKKAYKISLFASLGAIFLSFIISLIFRWSWITLLISIITILVLMCFYTFFRLYRENTYFKDNVRFIKIMSAAWLSTFIALFIANIFVDELVNHINPLLIILLYLVNAYGLIMVIVKHILFYYDEDFCNKNVEDLREKFIRYKYLLPLVIILVVLFSFGSSRLKNDLHTLPDFAQTSGITIQEYQNDFFDRHRPDSTKKFYQIACYGGGLKANLWNLLVLNKLQDTTNGEFMNSVFSMSGTSGGAIGLGNYAILWGANYDSMDIPGISEKLWPQIYDIGNFNHLLIDVTYLMGFDYLREFIPLESYDGTDRSYKAMAHYAELSGLNKIMGIDRDTTFAGTWKALYKKVRFFPALIVNSFAVSGQQGNAITLQTNEFHRVFPGAINLIGDKTSLSYYGALSTSNRFPVFSPTAHVQNKGHFLDGGYFDNSALSSTLSFYNYSLKEIKNPISYIIINNSKSDYIRFAFREYLNKGIKENQVGEFSAILQAVSGIDKIPNFFEGVIHENNDLYHPEHIFLPQPITYDDINNAFYGMPIMDPEQIIKFIEGENNKIEKALDAYSKYDVGDWGIIYPPLARLNSIPAIRYQEAMIHYHEDVVNSISRIIK